MLPWYPETFFSSFSVVNNFWLGKLYVLLKRNIWFTIIVPYCSCHVPAWSTYMVGLASGSPKASDQLISECSRNIPLKREPMVFFQYFRVHKHITHTFDMLGSYKRKDTMPLGFSLKFSHQNFNNSRRKYFYFPIIFLFISMQIHIFRCLQNISSRCQITSMSI